MHPACLADDELQSACEVERLRRSGPGGQHRNKVETAIRLTHAMTGLVVEASERRSQAENLASALRRMRMLLATAHREAPTDSPSELWRARCRNGRLVISARHSSLPCLIAELLDVLAACDWNVQAAGERLDCSSSQLVKLLSHDARALGQLNEQRVHRGQRRLSPR